MIIFKKVIDTRRFIAEQKKNGRKIGFVPTMGALHEGHLSLVRAADADGMLKVCSIFLNPTQFNEKSDLEKYPVSTVQDVELLVAAGCDVLFLPPEEEIYPNGTGDGANFDFGNLDSVLEGARRPGHFRGVGQVVSRLLDIVMPDQLYLGQKDYQQCLVIRKLMELKGSEAGLTICPTSREPDGLAMSSRNRRLTESQRSAAAAIYQCLVSIQSKIATGQVGVIRKECEELLKARGFEPEYVALADAGNLEPVENYKPEVKTIALIAARLGEIRLIDNMYI